MQRMLCCRLHFAQAHSHTASAAGHAMSSHSACPGRRVMAIAQGSRARAIWPGRLQRVHDVVQRGGQPRAPRGRTDRVAAEVRREQRGHGRRERRARAAARQAHKRRVQRAAEGRPLACRRTRACSPDPSMVRLAGAD